MIDYLEEFLLWCFWVLSLYLYLLNSSLCSSISSFPPSFSSSWAGQLFHGIVGIYSRIFQVCDQHEGDDQNRTLQEKANEDQERVSEIAANSSPEKLPDTTKNNSSNTIISKKPRMRPAKLVMPEDGFRPSLEFIEMGKKTSTEEKKEFEVEGRDFCLASKKGSRGKFMEDGHGVMVDIMGDPTQAFFQVIDGHGGRAAADYVAENLGKNIVEELEHSGDEEHQVKQAIRRGYLLTDKAFLSQGVSSGACTTSVVVKDGELHVANVGDCRAVLSNKGLANLLTNDHRLHREDERLRIENTGGFVQHSRNGVWRLQGSLAVSRAIGDQHLKQWVISEPEIRTIPLTSDCEFLILASDGLWDKVDDQEAVDVVLRVDQGSLIKACKELVDISSSRGNLDDITVMVINLQNFVPTST